MKKFVLFVVAAIALAGVAALTPAHTALANGGGQCQMELTKTASKSNAKPGDIIEYKVTVTNKGTINCTGGGVELYDYLDSNVDFVQSTGRSAGVTYGTNKAYDGDLYRSGHFLRWNLDVIKPGESKWVSFTVKVKNPGTCGNFEVKNQAKATAWEYNQYGYFSFSNTVKTTINNECCVAPSITMNSGSQTGTVGTAFNFTPNVSVTNGTAGDVSFSVVGTLPAGLTFNSVTGKVSGTATAAGNFKIKATVATNCGTDTAEVAITINPYVCVAPAPTLQITSGNATGTVGTPFSYTATFNTNDADGNLQMQVSTLPAGLTRNNRTISGTPTEAGSFTITATAKNECGEAISKQVTITINPYVCQAPNPTLQITSGNAEFMVGEAFSYEILLNATNDADGNYQIAVTGLPAGVTRSGRIISGTATETGTITITATAKNECGVAVTKQVKITLTPYVCSAPAPTIAFTSGNATGTVGTPFSYTATFNVTNDEDGNLQLASTTLPAGITRSGRTFSGTPTETGTFTLSATAKNKCGEAVSTSVTITINPIPRCEAPAPTVEITSGDSSGKQNVSFSYTITTTQTNDEDGNVVIRVSQLPAGLTRSGRVISGTPSETGSFTITAEVENRCGEKATDSVTITISKQGGGGSCSNCNNNDFDVMCRVSDTRVKVGEEVRFEADVDNGNSPFDYDWSGDIDGNDRIERVTFNKAGRYTVKVTVRDDDGERASDSCSTVVVEDDGEVAGVYITQRPIPAQEQYVYLTQVPYTGVGDMFKITFITLLLLVLSLGASYYFMPKAEQKKLREWLYRTFPYFFPGYAKTTPNVIDYNFASQFTEEN